MPKYICLDKELDISKYQQLKSIQEGFEIVYDNGWSQLGSPYPLDINQTETYQCFDKISRSIHKTRLKKDYNEMAFDWVYDIGQINDVYLALALSENNINLIIDISFEDLEEVSDQVETLSDKYEAADLIKGSIGDMLDQINGYGDKLEGDIDLEELSNFSGYEYDLRQIMRRCEKDIYDALIEYQHTPTV
jgi:hypothetical protein